MNFLEQVKKIFGNRKKQKESRIKESSINKDKNQESYEIYHEDEETEVKIQIQVLAENIKWAFNAPTPDEENISGYNNALKKIKSEMEKRGINAEINTDSIFCNLINELQIHYNSEKKEPVNYDEIKKKLEEPLVFEWGTGNEETTWRHFCNFNYEDIINKTKLKAIITRELDECYEILGDECLDKDFGELVMIRGEFASLFGELNKIINDYSKIISEMVIRNDYKVTDEKLKEYVTTDSMKTAISQTAESIKSEASREYATFQYVDNTAGNLASEAETNAKGYADKVGTGANSYADTVGTNAKNYADTKANKALTDAKADTDEKLKKYVTQVSMNTAIDQSAESVKTYAKKAVNELKHNYVENGTFESGNLDGWDLSDNNNIKAINDEYLGNVASITRGTSNIYMRQSWKLKAGTYTVRFKAGANLRSISKARIRVSLGGTSYYTKAGELDDEVFKQYETEITISAAGTKYLYVYNYVDNTTVYIKDVEVLGKYEDHAEAQFTVANGAIEAEVKRAEGIEDELRSAIKVNANNITSKVEKGDMGSYVTQYYNNVLVAFNNSSKYVQISAGQIAIYNGEVTTKGKRAVFNQSGNSFYRDNYFVGRIGTNEWKNNSAHKGLTFDLEYQGKYMAWAQEESSSATSYDTILCYSRANSIYTEKGLHFGCNVYAHGWNLYNADLRNTSYDGYSGWTGEIPIITKIQANSDGTITWWSSSITVRNGGITSAPRS